METRVEWMTGAGGLLAGSLLLATSCSAGVADASDPAADAAAEARPPVGVVDTLPLRRGYYVRAETPCGEASRADVFALLTRTGTNLNCRFERIERTGATTYRVTELCSDGGAGWGRDEQAEPATSIYEIPDERRFTVTYDGGSQVSARHCEQADMPDDYRDNDIGDLIR